jgi:hypothetical protein
MRRSDFLSAWWETQLFSEAERAALQYAEALTRTADTTVARPFQQYHDSLAAYFDEPAMLEIVAVVINMNIRTRLKLAEGAMRSTSHGHGAIRPGRSRCCTKAPPPQWVGRAVVRHGRRARLEQRMIQP